MQIKENYSPKKIQKPKNLKTTDFRCENRKPDSKSVRTRKTEIPNAPLFKVIAHESYY